ncbi:hypothetical protein K439DRAFT_1642761 [Ramaria rubella]|nr:hypothetical protein K439DRAFT_1642761 [Ramaria rubella]
MIHLVDHRNLTSVVSATRDGTSRTNHRQQMTLMSHSIITEGTPLAPDLRFHLRNVIDVPIDDFQESSSRFWRGPVASL